MQNITTTIHTISKLKLVMLVVHQETLLETLENILLYLLKLKHHYLMEEANYPLQ